MSTTNNNTANYTVENLIAKYYNYVNEHCPKSSEASEWVDKEGKYHFEEIHMPFSPEANVVEQLLVVLYKKVEGDKAQKEILDALSKYADVFYTSALSDNEMSFLCDHYKEVVSYLFAHREKWEVGIKTGFGQYSKVRERLVKEYAKPGSGAKMFIADTEYCELAAQFPNCIVEGFTGWNYKQKEVWALGQIRLKAMGIESRIVSGEEVDGNYTYTLPKAGSMDFVIVRVNENKYFAQKIFGTECTDIDALYNLLKPDGKMLFFSESKNELAGTEKNSLLNFRERIVMEKAISSLVEYEDKVYIGDGKTKYIMLVLTKSLNQNVSIIDETKLYKKVIPIEQMDSTILWPSYYMTFKPKDGIALSEIVSFHDLGRRWEKDIDRDLIIERENGDWILSENAKKMPVVAPVDMSTEYKDANLCEVQLKLAGDSIYNQWIGWLRKIEQPCILLFGKKEKFVVGYINQLPEGGIATLDSVVCLIPKKGIDVRYVAALLLTPEVKNQIMSICEGVVNDSTFPLVINKVIVPNHTEKERLSFLSEVNYVALIDTKKEMQEVHQKEVDELNKKHMDKLCNYQHGMRKPIREIGSAVRRMERYVKESDMDVEIKDYLLQRICHIKNQKAHLSEDIERLNEENTYDEATVFDIDHCLRSFLDYFGKDIDVKYENVIAERAVNQYQKSKEYTGLKENEKRAVFERKKDELSKTYVDIAEYNFKKIVKRILDNAEDHGFSNSLRNDCTIEIILDWDADINMYRIDFRNNGNPLPEGLTKENYGEYKKYGGLTGKSGIGGYEVSENIKHYGGDFTLIQDNDWVVIRIFLPKSRAYERL